MKHPVHLQIALLSTAVFSRGFHVLFVCLFVAHVPSFVGISSVLDKV